MSKLRKPDANAFRIGLVCVIVYGLACIAITLVLALAQSASGAEIDRQSIPVPESDTIRGSLARNVAVSSSTGTCGGVIIESGLVLTAKHCEGVDMAVDNAPASVVRRSTKDDLLLLRASTKPFAPVEIEVEPHIIDTVVAIVNTYDYRGMVSIGRVMFLSASEVVYSGVAMPGFSGSPIYDTAGKLVGLNVRFGVSRLAKPDAHVVDYAIAVHPCRIARFLER